MEGERLRGTAFGLCLLLVGCGATTRGGNGGTGGNGGLGGAAGATSAEASIVFIDPLPEHVEAAEAVSNGQSHAVVHAASIDPLVLAGVSDVATDAARSAQVFRWTRASRTVSLGGLPDTPQPGGIATFGAMSADGSVIVGTAPDANNAPQTFRWTEQAGMVAIGPVTPGSILLSDDGAAVAYTHDGVAFRWSEDSGLETLAPPFEGENYFAQAIHPDGTEVYGQTLNNNQPTPWRWTTQRGTEAIALPDGVDGCVLSNRTLYTFGSALVLRCAERRSLVYLPESGVVEVEDLEDYPLVHISAISKDGSVVFGEGQRADQLSFRAVRFTVESGTVALLPDQSSSIAIGREAISLDGSVAIGKFVADDRSDSLFRWEAGKGYIELSAPDGYELAELSAVRPDGAYVVGNARLDNVKVPVIWDRTGAPHVLADYLSAAGLDLGDNVLTQANFESETGLLFGNAEGSSGHIRAFVVALP